MSLPSKSKMYAYPRDVQSEVWAKWFRVRTQKNTIVKMNTGSGKTVVGLMILQSSLNEGVGPAVYIVPDNYLVQQVIHEAKELGINVTDDIDDYHYTENNAILVATIQKLVNGKSVFGMRDFNNYNIGSVIIDDVHACMDTISKQFSMTISSENDIYQEIKKVLIEPLSNYDLQAASEIFEQESPRSRILVPFWIWQEHAEEIYRVLQANDEDKEILFSLPLLRKYFNTCNCVITSKSIEISPLGNDISLIKSFQNAKRRVFMSATLADDSVFVSALGLQPEEIKNIITPNRANDIGARLILFPKHLNNSINDDEIRQKAQETAKKYNVVVIVPSFEQAKYWNGYATIIAEKNNILETVEKLKKDHVGLVVFINRYDGIDLPDDACRMLIIDSLPPLNKEYNKYVYSICADSNLFLREQMQKVEQGMGRGVRSSTDSCCIILMGRNLTDVLIRQNGRNYFSQATAKQYDLSRELWKLLKEENDSPTIDDIFEIANYSLKPEPSWIQQCKSCLSEVVYSTEPQIDETDIAIRKAFVESLNGRIDKSLKVIEAQIAKVQDDSIKGYLMQIKALYLNLSDPIGAQKILLAAKSLNRSVLSPIDGVQYPCIINKNEQANNILSFCNTYSDRLSLDSHLQKVLYDLKFESDASTFERGIEIIGKFLGFESSRQDRETNGKGPDNLWALGNGKYWVIECKNEAVASEISKEYCNQLGGSMRWFYNKYPSEYVATPIMIHQSFVISSQATPNDGMRVITEQLLNKLKTQIHAFYQALIKLPDWNDPSKLNYLLQNYRLNANSLLQQYTCDYRK